MKKQDFCKGWLFAKQDGSAHEVCLPHDAMLEEPRSADAPSGSGGAFFAGGRYTYTNTFTAEAGEHIEIVFGGVYRCSEVRINGQLAGGCDYGYSEFSVTADSFMHSGENSIEVTVDNSETPNSRWYSGAGIFRPVCILRGGKKHIAHHGLRVSTLSCSPARVLVEAEHTGGELRIELLDGERVIASGAPGEYTIPDAKLWSDETPHLYRCRAILSDCGAVVDEDAVEFGVRVVEWSRNGLFVNGKKTLLRGGCIHHDCGVLGAASVREAEWRRIAALKAAGFNAIRSAHNPASAETLRACDHYGVYVMDETWDMWYHAKTKHDYSHYFEKNWREDVRTLVRRDFNHPSVILYSIGNEVSEPHEQRGVDLAHEIVELFHKLDSSRPVTGGMNLMIITMAAMGNNLYQDGENTQRKQEKPVDSTTYNQMISQGGAGMNLAANRPEADAATSPVLDLLDIAGYNYASGRYPLEAEAHPDRVVVGSETFPQDIVKNWRRVEQLPYVVGDFMWTAWDYLGETGIGAWSDSPDALVFSKPYPWLLADCGAFDILGDETAEVYLAQAAWGMICGAPKLAVQPVSMSRDYAGSMWRGTNAIPSWSWRGCEGRTATVEAYSSNAAEIELLLDGETLGRETVVDCCAKFETVYRPGRLTAVAYGADGHELGRGELVSAGDASPALLPEKRSISVGETAFIPVRLVDRDGNVESNDDRTLEISVENGALLGFGSARPRTEESFLDGSYTTYYGRAMAVVRADKAGRIRVRCGGAECTIDVR